MMLADQHWIDYDDPDKKPGDKPGDKPREMKFSTNEELKDYINSLNDLVK